MLSFDLKINKNQALLALGAEIDTTLAYYYQGKVFVSENLQEISNNKVDYEETIINFINQFPVKPQYILTDLNPEYYSVQFGAELVKKYQAEQIKIQHHHAHVFSSIAEHFLLTTSATNLPETIIGIACDGTGYGLDETIWGGEIILVESQPRVAFSFSGGAKSIKSNVQNISRIGYLEQQTMLGGQLAIEEPARMLFSVLAKFLDEQNLYSLMKRFYDEKTLKLFSSQLQQKFNCQETSSCGRILDAASALLLSCNERKHKHQAAKILEENASEPYNNIEPIIIKKAPPFQGGVGVVIPLILQTTPFFQYLIKNPNKDKHRLAATVHQYIASGLYQIANNYSPRLVEANPPTGRLSLHQPIPIIFTGGFANNQIFRKYFTEKNVLLNKKVPSGDPGIAVGQVVWCLLN